MPQVVDYGTLNTTALYVADSYVQVIKPQNAPVNGVPTGRLGIVGTASYGPVGEPVAVSTLSDFEAVFGRLVARKHDLGTVVATAAQQGANDIVCTRVTDGTDKAASGVLGGLTLTAAYTGTTGNKTVATLTTGSRAGTWAIVIGLPGVDTERFDNLSGTGAAFWAAAAAAINNGTDLSRGPSHLVTAVAGPGTDAPAAASVTLSGGTDGADGVTSQTLVGEDGETRTGMYALRGVGCGIATLADADDSTQWPSQVAFGQSERVYMVLVTPAGDTVANAIAAKAAIGIDSVHSKMLLGDYIWWSDSVNNTVRLVSPQGFAAGRLANLAPNRSSLNQPLAAVIGSQRSGTANSARRATYSYAEIQKLVQAGIDVICNPVPGGSYWACRTGHNTSSTAAINGDNYTRMTNYLALTLAAAAGAYVGEPATPDLFRNWASTTLSFLEALLQQGILSLRSDGSRPFAVVCDASNNPEDRVGLGYVQQDVSARYTAIAEKFITNLEGGQTVSVAKLPNRFGV
ncbi:Phage tail protein (plasmid) [Rhodovastum atsumiense]|uniref:Phage tail protein n=1 Tax=Rhodovastum atsumiense TaxID=504468 RepID=A0A5M6IU78_9PROT|nr:phage tail protein [Rhodovastum atsumiense]KAA5611876.1 phage tail protein [Rhodovastum atsumiense]CAH2606145.1 Phage tail protein [Rhodovastum atsumiense]